MAKKRQRKLTGKQRAFAHEYAIDHNATQAAIRAGYAESGAASHGGKLTHNDSIMALVRELEAEIRPDLDEWIVARLVKMAEGDTPTSTGDTTYNTKAGPKTYPSVKYDMRQALADLAKIRGLGKEIPEKHEYDIIRIEGFD